MRPQSLIIASSLVLTLSGCGKSAGGSANPAAATIAYIRQHGFPKLTELMPALPAQLARIPGVATGETGLPNLPAAVAGADFDHMSTLLTEAQSLAAQGFSESRRLEATLLNLITPAYDLLGRADLFAPGENDSSSGATLMNAQGLVAGVGVAGAAQSLFENLLSETTYAMDVGGKDGLPQYLVLGIDANNGAVKINGLWPKGGEFATGFAATVRLAAADDFAVSLTFAPSQLAGLLPAWTTGECGDDVWQVAFGSQPQGDRSLSVTARECASERDAVSQLALARADSDGAWKLTGAFAQNFAGADAGTLRGFLGERQGFVMQAAAASDASKLAAAAAILGESDFKEPSQAVIDEFGVGAILAHYFQAKYFDPKVKAAADGSIADQYGNVAYWMCEATGVSSAVQANIGNARELCRGTRIDVESILTVLKSVQAEIKDEFLVPDSVSTEIDRVLGVLSIRNTLFVGSTGDLAFKTAPDEAFAGLDTARKEALPKAVGGTDWIGGAQAGLPLLTRAQIPDTAFKALESGLGGFLNGKCKALASDAQAKAGKADTADAVCLQR